MPWTSLEPGQSFPREEEAGPSPATFHGSDLLVGLAPGAGLLVNTNNLSEEEICHVMCSVMSDSDTHGRVTLPLMPPTRLLCPSYFPG